MTPISSPSAVRGVGLASRRRWLGLLLRTGPVLALAGCGYALGPGINLAPGFRTTVLVGADPAQGVWAEFARQLRTAGGMLVTPVAAPTGQGEVVAGRVEVLRVQELARPLSLDQTGERQLVQVYLLMEGRLVLTDRVRPFRIELSRDYRYAAGGALAKANEESLLRDALRQEAARRLLQRLDAASWG